MEKKMTDHECSVKGCNRPARALGLCSAHYDRSRTGRDMSKPLRSVYRGTGGDKVRFMSKVKVAEDTQCWEWKASKTPNGYGQFRFNGTRGLAHRVSWMLFKGEIPSNPDHAYGVMGVLHKCDNPGCVNPDHLFIGDQSDNSMDSVNKNRWGKRGCPGETHGRALLTEAQVLEIRASTDSLQALADRYGISKSAAAHIRYRRSWKHIP